MPLNDRALSAAIAASFNRWDEKVDPRSRITLSYPWSTHSQVQSQLIRRSTLKKD